MEPRACTTPDRVWLGEGAVKGQLPMGILPMGLLREYSWGLSVVSDAYQQCFSLAGGLAQGCCR